MYILYDVENNVGIRTTSLESVQKVKEINPLIKEVMSLSGWQISAANLFGNTMGMNSQVYTKFFKEQRKSKNIKDKVIRYFAGCKCWYMISGNKHLCIVKEFDAKTGLFTLLDTGTRFVHINVNSEHVFKTSDKFGSNEKNWYPGQSLFHFETGKIGAFESIVILDIDFDSGKIKYVSEDGKIGEDDFNNFNYKNIRYESEL